jgi:hypothetical protein
MQGWLPVVDLPVRGQADEKVLVDRAQIGIGRLDVPGSAKDRPRSCPDVAFASDRGEGRDELLIGEAGAANDELGVEPANAFK